MSRRSEPGCVTAAGRGLPDRIVRGATSPARGRGSKQALGHRVVHVVQWWYSGWGRPCELRAASCLHALVRGGCCGACACVSSVVSQWMRRGEGGGAHGPAPEGRSTPRVFYF